MSRPNRCSKISWATTNSRDRSNVASCPGCTLSAIWETSVLTWALTHRSLAYETNPETLPDPAADNEQLEFVGDAVLGLAVAESLFRRFPASREGELTRLRASLVSRRHLGEVAARIDLGSLLRLGRGEEQSGGRKKPALLANALEAVIAAVELLKERSSRVARVAVVLLGQGFWASAIQSTVTGLQLVAPRSLMKVRIFENLDEAADWLPPDHAAFTGVTLDPADLRTVLRDAVACAENAR